MSPASARHHRRLRYPLTTLALFAVAYGCAISGPRAIPQPAATLARVDSGLAIAHRADTAYTRRDFAASARLYAQAAPVLARWLVPDAVYLNAARAWVLAGDDSRALEELARSIRSGARDTSALVGDTIFARLRDNPGWLSVLAEMRDSSTSFAREHANPGLVRFVTADISRFWIAHDSAEQLADSAARVAVYRDLYVEGGSPGLLDYYYLKVGSVERLSAVVHAHPRYYESIRGSTLGIATRVAEMRASFVKLKEWYPPAQFPDVYFVVGRFSSAGTVSAHGLLLGVEQSAATPQSPLDEIKTQSVRDFIAQGGIAMLPHVVAHELVHFQQREGPNSLLVAAIHEGSADFIGELISGRQTNTAAKAFGDAHETEVFTRFVRDMHGTDQRDWIANGGSNRVNAAWIADLGYYVGYRISKGYFDHALDKGAAVRDLIELKDAGAVFAASRVFSTYGPH